MKASVPPEQITNYVARNEKQEVTDHLVMARKKILDILSTNNRREKRKSRLVKISITCVHFQRGKV